MSLRATQAATKTISGAVQSADRGANRGVDLLPASEIARALVDAHSAALTALTPALEQITQGAEMMAHTLREGGSLVYGAAGSSGLMAAADALELSGTFGLDPERIHILMAGGQPGSSSMPGDTEDDTDEALRAAAVIRPGDCVIVVTASGSTPFAVTLARAAQQTGAQVIGIANKKEAPLFQHVDLAICLETPPEPVAGSTRLGAGTAQKTALNTMSTLMAVKLGHVHDGMMVNLRVDNAKLRQRATQMVATIAQVSETEARAHLQATDNAVKLAVLLAAGAPDRDQAEALLTQTKGHLRAALARL